MKAALRGLSSTVGTKILVAVSGVLLVGFVLQHLLGNLQIYLGASVFNGYAASLKSLGPLIWVARLGLLAALIVHLVGIAKLTLRNRAARPQAYESKSPILSTFASRNMLMSGGILLAFIIYHLLHFTLGVTHPEHYLMVDDVGRHDVYSMVILGFRQPLVSLSYIVAMGLLGLHLGHGVASLFQTAGFSGRNWRATFEGLGRLVAVVVVLGNISIPLACLFGLIQPLSEAL